MKEQSLQLDDILLTGYTHPHSGYVEIVGRRLAGDVYTPRVRIDHENIDAVIGFLYQVQAQQEEALEQQSQKDSVKKREDDEFEARVVAILKKKLPKHKII